MMALLPAVAPPAPGRADDPASPAVRPAPLELREAVVLEEPSWEPDMVLREIRERERLERARAVREARAEVRAEMQATLNALEASLERARTERSGMEAALAGAGREARERDLRIAGLEKRMEACAAADERLAALRGERDAALEGAARAESEREDALGRMAALEEAAGETERLRAALEAGRADPEEICAASVQEAYRRARDEAEAEWARSLQGRRSTAAEEAARLRAALQRREEEMDRLRRDMDRAEPDCAAPAAQAYARGRQEAEAACVAEAAGPPRGEGRFERRVETEVRRRLGEIRAEQKTLAEEERELAVAEAESEAVARMEEYFRELRTQMEGKAERLRSEERARADKAFQRVLHAVSSREERQRARELWEQLR